MKYKLSNFLIFDLIAIPLNSFNNKEAGLSVNLDRLVAQEQLLAVELELADAQFTKKIDYFELLRVIGRFSEESLQEGFKPCPEN